LERAKAQVTALVEPKLATSAVPANLDGWVAEPRLDGRRARLLVDHDGLALRTRSGRDM
jgi:ATP-dependent DNA ligase